jgi:hypothetical protein
LLFFCCALDNLNYVWVQSERNLAPFIAPDLSREFFLTFHLTSKNQHLLTFR